MMFWLNKKKKKKRTIYVKICHIGSLLFYLRGRCSSGSGSVRGGGGGRLS